MEIMIICPFVAGGWRWEIIPVAWTWDWAGCLRRAELRLTPWPPDSIPRDRPARPRCLCAMRKHWVLEAQNEGKLLWLFNYLYPLTQVVQSSAPSFTQHDTLILHSTLSALSKPSGTPWFLNCRATCQWHYKLVKSMDMGAETTPSSYCIQFVQPS